MLAGKTGHNVGTRVKITKSIFKELVGKTGELTKPFGNSPYAMAGVVLDKEAGQFGRTANLFDADDYEVLAPLDDKKGYWL